MTFVRRPRSYVWKWELDAAPAALWPRVADTDRFNQDTGLPTEPFRAPIRGVDADVMLWRVRSR